MTDKEEISFLPDGYLERKGQRRTLWTGIGVVCAVGATLAVCTVRAGSNLREAERAHALVSRDYDTATLNFNRLCQQKEAQRKLIQHAVSTAALVERVPRSTILAELTRCLPQGASLLDINVESRQRQETAATTSFDMKKAAIEARHKADAVNISEISPTEISLRISGLAETDVQVAHYLSELDHSPLFHDVSLMISEAYATPGRNPGPSLRRFQIQMTANPDTALTPRAVHREQITAGVDN